MHKLWETLRSKKAFTALLVLCGAIVFYMALAHFSVIWGAAAGALTVLRPLIAGAIIAYLINPAARFFETRVFGRMKRRGLAHALSAVLVIVLAAALAVLLVVLVVPQLVSSVTYLLHNIDGYVASFTRLLKQWQAGTVLASIDVDALVGSAGARIGTWQDVFETATKWIAEHGDGILGATVSAGSGIFEGVMAVMFAVYILLDKQRIARGFCRWCKSVMEQPRYDRMLEIAKRSDGIFMRYFIGNLLDSLIIGILCYLFMVILHLPYPVLISIIVALTNFIPTFGPVIGVVMGGFVILIVEPIGVLWFVLFTIVSQSLDVIVIKPLLFGDSTGLRPLWVLVAIIVGGGLFGVAGMLLGIPVTAILATIIEERTLRRLAARGLDGNGDPIATDEKQE